MSLIRRIIRRASESRNRYYNNRVTAANPRHDDIYIVEFPKSGVTWLSCLLANAALIESNKNEVANFVSTRLYIPDIHLMRKIGDPTYSVPSSRLIKSHSLFNLNYNFVIYLCREPASVMRSYYNYLLAHGARVGEFESFCFNSRNEVGKWKKHVRSWLDGPVTGRPLHLIRYEDLVQDTFHSLRALSINFGWQLSDKAIKTAEQRATIDEMKKSEIFYQKYNPRHSITFVGNGNTISNWEKTRRKINVACQCERKLLGYV